MARMAMTVDVDSVISTVSVAPLEAGTPTSYTLGAPTPLPEPPTGMALLAAIPALVGLSRLRAGSRFAR